ncbi:ERCC4 domain-containing protein [Candidatus Pacearchaeota archaeon]|nr:ERCC4 domain-containing protein [Candidatus Pacearchaeota archaeon]
MGHTKTAGTYVQEIEQLHNTIKIMEVSPERTKKEKQLHRKLGAWEAKVSKVVYVANNEQTPWPLFEAAGLPVRPMETKAKTGYLQVGDYVCCVFIEDGRAGKPESYYKYLPLVIERKTVNDLYSSIVPADAWGRLKKEINRFHHDDRFNRMVIIAETDIIKLSAYKPKFIIKTVIGNDGKKKFKKVFNTNKPISPEVADAKIAKCFVLGAPVMFAGTTSKAMSMYKHLIRQTIIEQYDVLLGLWS